MRFLVLLCFCISIFSCSDITCPELEKPSPVKGLWALHSMEQSDSLTGKWSEWKGGMQGYLLYDDQENMALHLTKKGYQDFPIAFPNFVDTIPQKALEHLTNSYVYFAKYSLDTVQGIVTHARISHSNPAEWNDVVERRYSFKGDTLMLAPVEEKNKSLRLKWLRN